MSSYKYSCLLGPWQWKKDQPLDRQNMNKELLGDCPSLQGLRRWMDAGMRSLWDISVWQESHWAGWKLEMPPDLAIEREELIYKLHGLAPFWMRSKDTRGWGVQASGYSVAQGYAKLCKCPHVAMNPEPWKGIWYHPPLPKIDFFNWLLCHSKIFTVNNLLQHGFHGPSRCRLCKAN
jgi:hypothetical protein